MVTRTKKIFVGGLSAPSTLEDVKKYFEQFGKPLYSSHMIDLSEEPITENIELCKQYLARMSKMGMTLEIELGITGGKEPECQSTSTVSHSYGR